MSTWVRKDSAGNVLEKTNQDPTGRFHPDIIWTKLNATPEAAYSKTTISKPAGGGIIDEIIEDEEESTEEVEEDTANTEVESTE
jgi:hypothetical protein